MKNAVVVADSRASAENESGDVILSGVSRSLYLSLPHSFSHSLFSLIFPSLSFSHSLSLDLFLHHSLPPSSKHSCHTIPQAKVYCEVGELVNGSVKPITTDTLKSLEKKFIVFKSLGKHK